MLIISDSWRIVEAEIDYTAIRSSGSGGQHVNKVATAIHLQFDSQASSLPDYCKAALLAHADARINDEGVITIKAQRFRSQDRNRDDARQRLNELVSAACQRRKKRLATRPTRGSKTRRLDGKTRRGAIKSMRGKVDPKSDH